ncbi:MAG: trypsin-like serine protease with C-terminal domain [Actinomycetia bacterium]|nr:trypsin-like serine protease with C-terminal domain [Actinomycetes bacterium]
MVAHRVSVSVESGLRVIAIWSLGPVGSSGEMPSTGAFYGRAGRAFLGELFLWADEFPAEEPAGAHSLDVVPVVTLREVPGAAGDEHDDLDDEPDPIGAPPHPMDRVWRHPSELPPVGSERRPTSRTERARAPWWLLAASAGAGALVTVAALAAFGVFDDLKQAPAAIREARVRVEDQAVATQAANVAPSVVTISAISALGTRRGSGVCVRHAGDILTSDRLVRNASSVLVTTHDGTTRTAVVQGHDPDTDLALVHIPTGLEAAPIASVPVHAGDTVLAVGAAAANKEPWIGNGIVSSVDGSVSQAGGPTMDRLIATNASPGRSGMGGALLDRQGNVTGILLAPVDGDTSTYAVPIALAAQVAAQLDAHSVASHGWLGVDGVDAFGVPMVTAMSPDGPAAHAGLRVNDVVVSIDDTRVTTMGDVTAAIRWYSPSTPIVVKVKRGTALFNMHVVLGNTATATPANAASAGGA